jgi:hypothetical protein
VTPRHQFAAEEERPCLPKSRAELIRSYFAARGDRLHAVQVYFGASYCDGVFVAQKPSN